MYKTAVYTLVNGVIAHQKQQISKRVILLSSTFRRDQSSVLEYSLNMPRTLTSSSATQCDIICSLTTCKDNAADR